MLVSKQKWSLTQRMQGALRDEGKAKAGIISTRSGAPKLRPSRSCIVNRPSPGREMKYRRWSGIEAPLTDRGVRSPRPETNTEGSER
jgi:hypothetical protein